MGGGVVRWLQRCGSCGVWIRARGVETSGKSPLFDVEALGRPRTRRTVEVPWDEAARRRTFGWLFVASVVTVSLVLVLYVLARSL